MIKRRESLTESSRQLRWWTLAVYDFIPLLLLFLFILVVGPSEIGRSMTGWPLMGQIALGTVCIYALRGIFGVYKCVWRYADAYNYIRLMQADVIAGVLYYGLGFLIPIPQTTFLRKMAIVAANLLCSICMRLIYQFLYQQASRNSRMAKILRPLTKLLLRLDIAPSTSWDNRIKIAIVGAGRVGTTLAEELLNSAKAPYLPCCFIDTDPEKIGREIYSLPVLSEREATLERLAEMQVQEIVFALPKADSEKKQALYEHYKRTGCRIKTYDYPLAQTTESGKRHMREFDINDLLFRQERMFIDDATVAYYEDRVVLISGGGGSIGSEMCRQIARMSPKKLIILDIYENGAYDIQQELRIAYGEKLNICVEIASVCDKEQLRKVFACHKPHIVIHAAAHKHVPLMERNCCEAVGNNVFGTLNIVEVAEEFAVKKFIMVSTDKAVNPTNVMGATKRMCEMIVLSRTGKTNFSATRFGNVLGSNGSVNPLLKRQIANGGPVTITDKRIIRYFMTIPEASQLVLQSGAMAKKGELFVLDMGKPIKILDLAENMIRLSGFEPYVDIEIRETGLRPGEKLYEELLIRPEELDKTENKMIYIERSAPPDPKEIDEKLQLLRAAYETGDDEAVRQALKQAVPTYHSPSDVNAQAQEAREMQMV